MARILTLFVLLALALSARAEPPNATRVDIELAGLDVSKIRSILERSATLNVKAPQPHVAGEAAPDSPGTE